MLEQVLVSIVIPLVATVATPVALWLVHRLIRTLEAKTQVQLSQAEKDKIDEITRNAVRFAEQIGANAIKAGSPLTSAQKQGLAITNAIESAKAAGLSLDQETAVRRIESTLGAAKFPNII